MAHHLKKYRLSFADSITHVPAEPGINGSHNPNATKAPAAPVRLARVRETRRRGGLLT